MRLMSPFRLMNVVFAGFWISLLYGVISSTGLYWFAGKSNALAFWETYTSSFRTLFSVGLSLGTALVVFKTQELIPSRIEKAFSRKQLAQTKYELYRQRFFSRKRSVAFSSAFVVAGFVIFTFCQFPVSGMAGHLMLIPACAEYAFGVYVGRKLCYAGMMLHSLLEVKIARNVFKEHELDDINSYVNILSTLTIIFVYMHINNYTDGPFLCQSALGESARVFLILPAVIATPVLLIFNFYPRIILRKVYSQSIDMEIKGLQEKLRNENLSNYERRSYIIEFDKMSRDEMRYRLRLTLSDLPVGITILIMVLGPLLTK